MNKKLRSQYAGAIVAMVVLALQLPPLASIARGAPQENTGPKLNVEQAPINRDAKLPVSFAPVVKRVTPSVVNIYSTMTVHEQRNPLLDDPIFRRFFGEDGDQTEPRDHKAQGLGSGVIVSPDGYILTANHVVEGAEKVKVAMASGEKEFEARVVGTDPATDVAVLKIDVKTNLPAAVLADSDKMEVGDLVLAIGNPFGVGQTVTLGIVSALGRGGFGINAYENFIQTDAAINQGNSGGALVDTEGRVIGINTAILSRSGGNMGVGFAVPINMSRYVMDRIIKEGKVTRGYLGINIQPLTTGLARAFGLPDDSSGVLVGGVAPQSPAEKAGVRKGDVILELNTNKVTDARNLSLLVAQAAPGSQVNLRVLRTEPNSKTREENLTATLGELPQETMASRNTGTTPRRSQREHSQTSTDALDGVEVIDLSPAVGRQADVPAGLRGALVTKVAPDSNAYEAGLRPGDVILEINRQPVRNGDDAVKLSEAATGKTLLLNVWSSGSVAGRQGGQQASQGGTRYIEVDNTKRK